MSNEIVKVVFQGDELEAIPEGAKVHLPIRRFCDNLGIAHQRQLERLKTDPSICVTMMVSQMPGDDQAREVACIELRDLPLWLAKIHPSKVKASVRAKLIAYQREAAEVLAEHFFGPRRPVALTARPAVYNELGDAMAADDYPRAGQLYAALGCLIPGANAPRPGHSRAAGSGRGPDGDDAIMRAALQQNPGQPNLHSWIATAGVQKDRGYAAARRLIEAGEVANRGTAQQPRYAWHDPALGPPPFAPSSGRTPDEVLVQRAIDALRKHPNGIKGGIEGWAAEVSGHRPRIREVCKAFIASGGAEIRTVKGQQVVFLVESEPSSLQ